MHFSIEEATIARIHAAYRMGHLTARELVEGYLERIETYDKQGPSINSIVNISAQARERADDWTSTSPGQDVFLAGSTASPSR